jgi:hypothetical protein
MNDQDPSASPAARENAPAIRARDQLGALFFVLAIALACGAVAAGRDPHGMYFSHAVWWWVGWSLLMYTPALIFTLMPWTMRTVFSIPPRGAAEDATRAFYRLSGFVALMALVDAVITGSISKFPPRSAVEVFLVFVVAPLGVTPALVRAFRGKLAWLPVLLPLATFLNALVIEWVAGFFGKSLVG